MVFYGPMFYKTVEDIEPLHKDLSHSDRTRCRIGLCCDSSVWRVDLLPFPLFPSGCFFYFPVRFFPGNRAVSQQKASIKGGFMTFYT